VGQAHARWLRQVRVELPQPAPAGRFDKAHGAVPAVQARRGRLDGATGALAATPTWAPVVGRLGCLRGVGGLTALGWRSRSVTGSASPAPPSVPGWAWCPASSPAVLGALRARSQDRHTHARRLLVQAAWHHASRIGPAASSASVTPASPPPFRERADRAHPPTPPALASAGRWWQALHHQRGRYRPRACRLVLTPGRAGGLTQHR
jgi:hypothetical protein